MDCKHNLKVKMSTKRKRVSKKNKKSWRKNVDISDVDNFIQDQLLQERLGIKYAEEKDEDLFEIDVIGNTEEDISRKSLPTKRTEPVITIKENVRNSMRLRETVLPKCFEILEKRSAVPAAIKVKKRVKTQGFTKSAQRKLAIQNKALARKLYGNIKTQKDEPTDKVVTYDPWSEGKNEKPIDNTWLSNDTVRHTLQNTGQHKKQIPKSVHSKTSFLPAVEVPHPGLSYNPSLKDHTDILAKVAEQELEVIKEEKHLNRVTRNMFQSIPRDQMEKEWLSEMTVGLSMSNYESDEDSGGEYKALNPPVKNKKKPPQKKRKKQEAYKLKEQLKNQKINKKKLSDIYKLRLFNESLNKKEQRILKNMQNRMEKKLQRPFKTKSLSQIKYKEPEINFQLAEELSGNLRNITPEGNLLYERFKSLQKRNILQPTIKRTSKKSKGKAYERDHTKMDWERKTFKTNCKTNK